MNLFGSMSSLAALPIRKVPEVGWPRTSRVRARPYMQYKINLSFIESGQIVNKQLNE